MKKFCFLLTVILFFTDVPMFAQAGQLTLQVNWIPGKKRNGKDDEVYSAVYLYVVVDNSVVLNLKYKQSDVITIPENPSGNHTIWIGSYNTVRNEWNTKSDAISFNASSGYAVFNFTPYMSGGFFTATHMISLTNVTSSSPRPSPPVAKSQSTSAQQQQSNNSKPGLLDRAAAAVSGFLNPSQTSNNQPQASSSSSQQQSLAQQPQSSSNNSQPQTSSGNSKPQSNQNARWAEVNVAYYTKHGLGPFGMAYERESMSVYVSATSEIHAEGLAIVEFEKKYGGKADRAIFIRWLTQAEYTQIQQQEQERERQTQERERQARERQAQQERQERERQAQQERQERERQERERELAKQPPEKHEQKDFYGTWKRTINGVTQTITITENNFSLEDNDDSYWNMNIYIWQAMSNPPGYILDGSTPRTKSYIMKPPVRLYLSNGGKNLRCFYGDDAIDLNKPYLFSKQ
jgi:hypothetical protein